MCIRDSFRTELIAHIIALHHSGHRHLGGRPAGSGDAPTRLTERHFPVYIPPTSTMASPQRECRVCGASKKDGKRIRKQTRYMCASCGGIALCVVPCFQRYHTGELWTWCCRCWKWLEHCSTFYCCTDTCIIVLSSQFSVFCNVTVYFTRTWLLLFCSVLLCFILAPLMAMYDDILCAIFVLHIHISCLYWV